MLSSKFRFIWLRAFRGEDFFLNRSFRNNNFLWRSCFLTDHDKISNLYRGASIDASYKVSVLLDKRFQRMFLELDQSEIHIACGGNVYERIGWKCTIIIEGLPQMFSTKFLFIWANGYKRRTFLEIDQSENKIHVVTMVIIGSDQNIQSLQRIFGRFFLPNFGSFGQAGSDDKIFFQIDQSVTIIPCGGHVWQRIQPE